MKKILIYGDSNVWGDNFITNRRIDSDKQWPVILQKKLGLDYQILQEGLPGRIAGNDEEMKKYKNGKDTFVATFRTNAPIDTLIIALGTNDLQIKYHKTAKQIINDLEWYKQVVKESYMDMEDRVKYFKDGKMPSIIYIMPINFDYENGAKGIFNAESEIIRQEVIEHFVGNGDKLIIDHNMMLFEDGIHLNYDGHKKMADMVWEAVSDE